MKESARRSRTKYRQTREHDAQHGERRVNTTDRSGEVEQKMESEKRGNGRED